MITLHQRVLLNLCIGWLIGWVESVVHGSPRELTHSDQFGMQPLKDKCAKEVQSQLKPANILPELFSEFTSRFVSHDIGKGQAQLINGIDIQRFASLKLITSAITEANVSLLRHSRLGSRQSPQDHSLIACRSWKCYFLGCC